MHRNTLELAEIARNSFYANWKFFIKYGLSRQEQKAIIYLYEFGGLTVEAIAAKSFIDQKSLALYLRKFEKIGIAKCLREGRKSYYRLTEPGLIDYFKANDKTKEYCKLLHECLDF